MVIALILADPGYGYTDETLAPMIAALRQQPFERRWNLCPDVCRHVTAVATPLA